MPLRHGASVPGLSRNIPRLSNTDPGRNGTMLHAQRHVPMQLHQNKIDVPKSRKFLILEGLGGQQRWPAQGLRLLGCTGR